MSEIPSIASNDLSTQSKATALANYYFYNEGGPVSNIVSNVAGVNLTDVFAKVNSTRDNAITVRMLLARYSCGDLLGAANGPHCTCVLYVSNSVLLKPELHACKCSLALYCLQSPAAGFMLQPRSSFSGTP